MMKTLLVILCATPSAAYVAGAFPLVSALRPGWQCSRSCGSVMEAPSLREQMKAYLEMVQARGMELNSEQKKMLAEIEGAGDELLEQTGRVDFSGNSASDESAAPGGSDGDSSPDEDSASELRDNAPSPSPPAEFDGEKFRAERAAQAREAALEALREDEEGNQAGGIEIDPISGKAIKSASEVPGGKFGDVGYGAGMSAPRYPRVRKVEEQPTASPPVPLPPPAMPTPGAAATPPIPTPAPEAAPQPIAPAPVAVETPGAPIEAAALQLWIAQRRERAAAVELLSKSAAGNSLSELESAELRSALAALVLTLTTAGI